MDGCHLKQPFTRELKGCHLQYDRDCFNDEDPSYNREYYLVLCNNGKGTEGTPESERTHITHENISRIRVIPEKAERSSKQETPVKFQISSTSEIENLKKLG